MFVSEAPVNYCKLGLKKRGLTICISCNNWFRLQWYTSSIFVNTSDTEYIFIVLDQFCTDTRKGPAFSFHDNPVEPTGLTSVNNVVSDRISPVLKRYLPRNCAFFFCDPADCDFTIWRTRGIWNGNRVRHINVSQIFNILI